MKCMRDLNRANSIVIIFFLYFEWLVFNFSTGSEKQTKLEKANKIYLKNKK